MNRIHHRTFAFLIVLSILTGLGTSGFACFSTSPKNITIGDLLHKLSRSQAIELLGREHLLDSTGMPVGDPSQDWRERLLDSALKNKKSIDIKQLIFAPVEFEGFPAKVTILFGEDSSMSAIVSIPYRVRLGHPATLEDFNMLSKNIAKSIGEPTVSSEAYIDYMLSGMQSVFGTLKDGCITISILPRIGP